MFSPSFGCESQSVVGTVDPVCFLDVDGVLNTTADRTGPCPLHQTLVRRLVDVIERTGCLVVLSSTWRLHPSAKRKLLATLAHEGLHRSVVIGQTPELWPRPRANEIAEWLRLNGPVPGWVAVDDEDLMSQDSGFMAGHMVRTSPQTGFTESCAERFESLITKQLDSYESIQRNSFRYPSVVDTPAFYNGEYKVTLSSTGTLGIVLSEVSRGDIFDHSQGYWGNTGQRGDEQLALLVSGVKAKSVAAKLGILKDSVLLSIGGRAVSSIRTAEHWLQISPRPCTLVFCARQLSDRESLLQVPAAFGNNSSTQLPVPYSQDNSSRCSSHLSGVLPVYVSTPSGARLQSHRRSRSYDVECGCATNLGAKSWTDKGNADLLRSYKSLSSKLPERDCGKGDLKASGGKECQWSRVGAHYRDQRPYKEEKNWDKSFSFSLSAVEPGSVSKSKISATSLWCCMNVNG